jgi:hypothetical protein
MMSRADDTPFQRLVELLADATLEGSACGEHAFETAMHFFEASPTITLTREGNVRVRWRFTDGRFVCLEFTEKDPLLTYGGFLP